MRPARSRLATALIVGVTLVAGGELANAATWTPRTTTSHVTAAATTATGRDESLQADVVGAPGPAAQLAR